MIGSHTLPAAKLSHRSGKGDAVSSRRVAAGRDEQKRERPGFVSAACVGGGHGIGGGRRVRWQSRLTLRRRRGFCTSRKRSRGTRSRTWSRASRSCRSKSSSFTDTRGNGGCTRTAGTTISRRRGCGPRTRFRSGCGPPAISQPPSPGCCPRTCRTRFSPSMGRARRSAGTAIRRSLSTWWACRCSQPATSGCGARPPGGGSATR